MSCLPRALVLAALACIAWATPAGATGAASASVDVSCQDARLVPNKDNLARVRAATLCLLNLQRASRGLRTLRPSGQLRKAATAYSRTMVRRGFFDHVTPEGTTMITRVRSTTTYLNRSVRDWALGENLGWGSGSRSTPKHMVRTWMNSAAHRDNILNSRFRHVGIGVVRGAPMDTRGASAATYTTDFGYRTA